MGRPLHGSIGLTSQAHPGRGQPVSEQLTTIETDLALFDLTTCFHTVDYARDERLRRESE
jgi:hypothetical protein